MKINQVLKSEMASRCPTCLESPDLTVIIDPRLLYVLSCPAHGHMAQAYDDLGLAVQHWNTYIEFISKPQDKSPFFNGMQ